MSVPATPSADEAVVARWWRAFAATGDLPDELERVQGRLIRQVHRGALPSGPVYVKTMAFPRAKDRLRYLLRALPAAHEAEMLRRTAAAGIPCPDVLAVRTARRRLLPHRSMLVLRTLPVVAETASPMDRVRDEAALALRLCRAGIRHRDLHGENFVRLADGRLAVLDLQSARPCRPAAEPGAGVRLGLAARILRDRHDVELQGAVLALRDAGLLRDDREAAAARERAAADRRRYARSRLLRCLTNSTEFERTVHWWGTEHRLRGGLGEGRWWRGPRGLERVWIGQRARQLATGEALPFRGFFRKWWWLGGGAALYVPPPWSDERIEAEVRAASAAFDGLSAGEVGPSS